MERFFLGGFLFLYLVLQFIGSDTRAQTVVTSSVQSSAGGMSQDGGLTMIATVGQPSAAGEASAANLTLGAGFVPTLGADVEAPIFQHAPVASQANGQALPITATITDNTDVANAILYSRKGGDPSFSSLPMSLSGGEYQATIPAGNVTTRGIEYYMVATDFAGNTAREPSSGVHSVQVTIGGEGVSRGSAQPSGSEQTAYRLVSVPMDIVRRP